MTITEYIIVNNGDQADNHKKVAKLLDEGYTLVISWVVQDCVHHILSLSSEEQA